MAASSFGYLGPVPFLSLHATQNSSREYAYVLSNDMRVSLKKVAEIGPGDETDLAKVTQFVLQHLSELPKGSRYLTPKQLNSLIEKHNWVEGAVPISQLPGYEKDLSYSDVLEMLDDERNKGTLTPEDVGVFIQKFDNNLALFPWTNSAVHKTIQSSPFADQKKKCLIQAINGLAYGKNEEAERLEELMAIMVDGFFEEYAKDPFYWTKRLIQKLTARET